MCRGVPSGRDLEEKHFLAHYSKGDKNSTLPSTTQSRGQSGHRMQMACEEKHGL